MPWSPGLRVDPFALLPQTNAGDGAKLAEYVGGIFSDKVVCPASLGPLSPLPGKADSLSHPMFIGRGKPGTLMVLKSGVRFTNEANSYHDVCSDILRHGGAEDPSAFIICDRSAMRRYGLGAAKPFPLPLGPLLRSGYLKSGRTLEDLGAALGIDGRQLALTVARFNAHVAEGRDPDFGRGDNVYNWSQGDMEHKPNPCLGALEGGPYYGVRLTVGSLGTWAGLAIDASANVLDKRGNPIEALYAAGADTLNALAGDYIGAGVNLGPAMTFGYIAGCRLAGVEP